MAWELYSAEDSEDVPPWLRCLIFGFLISTSLILMYYLEEWMI